jgi:uncharacterized BrkB/YihY/UPF0761 family membrane protein
MTTAKQRRARLRQSIKCLIEAAQEFSEDDTLYHAAALSYQWFFSLFAFLFFFRHGWRP